jgi:hypothetical protein
MLSWLLPSIYCGTVNYFFIITCQGVVAVNWVLLIHKILFYYYMPRFTFIFANILF